MKNSGPGGGGDRERRGRKNQMRKEKKSIKIQREKGNIKKYTALM